MSHPKKPKHRVKVNVYYSTSVMSKYQTLDQVEEEYFRKHPEEIDDYSVSKR